MARTSDYAFAGVALLAILAPFETSTPIVRVPWQSISDVEVALLAAFATWAAALISFRTWPRWQTPLTAAWLALLAACAIAALVSPVSRTNALHMTGRLTAAFCVYLLTVNAIDTPRRGRSLMRLLLTSGALVSVLAVLEFVQVPAVLRALTVFRPGLSTVGAQVRAGGPLQYPTIASMYLEIVFALGVGLFLVERDEGRDTVAWAVFAALVLVAEAVVATYTRAGVVTMGITLALAAVMRYRRNALRVAYGRVDGGVRALAALAAIVAALVVASRSPQSMWLRLTTEGQEAWYRAAINPPLAITAQAGADAIVPLDVMNTGRIGWDSAATPPIYFSYHWLAPTGDHIVTFEGVRTPFERPVGPGETVAIRARVRAPRDAGDYRISWDLVQEGRLWFTTEPGAVTHLSRVTVNGEPPRSPLPLFEPPRPTIRPGRLTLWHAALAMVRAHPVLGVGPDNFRLSYGGYAGIATPDPRVHSNNMYLEVAAGAGALGAAAFLWLVWSARACGSVNIGAACALAAIAIHGLVDSFLSFAPTYVLFALTLGLACADGGAHAITSPEIELDARRV